MKNQHTAPTQSFWKSALSKVRLDGKTVLDAGTGKASAQFLCEKHPKGQIIRWGFTADSFEGENISFKIPRIWYNCLEEK